MTVIVFDIRELALGGDVPAAAGQVSVVYWDAHRPVTAFTVAGPEVVFARSLVVPFTDGVLDVVLDVAPTPPGLYARVTVDNAGARVFSRNVIIPDSDVPVPFGDLEVIDPATLAPVVVAPSLLDTIQAAVAAAVADLPSLVEDPDDPGFFITT